MIYSTESKFKKQNRYFSRFSFFCLFFMPENSIIFSFLKIKNGKWLVVGNIGGKPTYGAPPDFAPDRPVVRSSQFPAVVQSYRAVTVTVSVIVYVSYYYDTYHSIYNILFRYITKIENWKLNL